MTVLKAGGYPGIILLMAMESSIFPIPSELVIPPAAYWASQGEMSYLGVVLAGTFGCWVGAAGTYWVSRKLGLPFFLRFGKFFFLSPRKIELAQRWFQNNGKECIFFARLLPVVRHLIGIPAGIAEMDFMHYSLATVVGSAIWCSILAWFGPQIITPEMFQDADSLVHAVKQRTHIVALLVAILAGGYAILKATAGRRKPLTLPES